MAVVVPHTYLNARQPHTHKLNAIATIKSFSHYNIVNKNNNLLSFLSVLLRTSKPKLTIFNAHTFDAHMIHAHTYTHTQTHAISAPRYAFQNTRREFISSIRGNIPVEQNEIIY